MFYKCFCPLSGVISHSLHYKQFRVRVCVREALNGIWEDGQRTVKGKILSSGQYLAANSALRGNHSHMMSAVEGGGLSLTGRKWCCVPWGVTLARGKGVLE